MFGEKDGEEGAGFIGADAAVAEGVLQLSKGAGTKEQLKEGEVWEGGVDGANGASGSAFFG